MNSTPTLSLAEFRAARTYCPDLGEKLGDDSMAGQQGYLYCGNTFIEVVCREWPDKVARNQGAFCLTIGNMSRLSDNLASMEADLYEFAVSEDYCKRPTPTMLVDVYDEAGVRISERVLLAEVVGDDLDELEAAYEDLKERGETRLGGGAAPMYDLKRVREPVTLKGIISAIMAAMPITDADWGSQRQIDAENEAHEMARQYGVDTSSFETTKETTHEMLLRLAQMTLDRAAVVS